MASAPAGQAGRNARSTSCPRRSWRPSHRISTSDAIRRVWQDDPSTYLRVIASLVPKDFQVSSSSVLDQLSDDELAQWLALVREAKVAREQDEDRPERLQ